MQANQTIEDLQGLVNGLLESSDSIRDLFFAEKQATRDRIKVRPILLLFSHKRMMAVIFI